jgi:hypothetical protein
VSSGGRLQARQGTACHRNKATSLACTLTCPTVRQALQARHFMLHCSLVTETVDAGPRVVPFQVMKA